MKNDAIISFLESLTWGNMGEVTEPTFRPFSSASMLLARVMTCMRLLQRLLLKCFIFNFLRDVFVSF